MIFELKKRIYGFECDVYGHLNNANYLQLLESARAEAMIEMGMSISELRELDLQIFVREFELDYQKAIELEDIITIRSWYPGLNRLKGTWYQQIYNSRGELCFEAKLLAVFARGGKPQRLPQEVFELFLRFAEPPAEP